MFERWLSLVKLLFHIVFCCCYHVYGELKIITFLSVQFFFFICLCYCFYWLYCILLCISKLFVAIYWWI